MNIQQKIEAERRVYIPWASCRKCKFYRPVYLEDKERWVCFNANICKNAIEIHADETDYKGENDD